MNTMRSIIQTRAAYGAGPSLGRTAGDLLTLIAVLVTFAAAPALLTGCAGSTATMAKEEPPLQQAQAEPAPAPEPQPPAALDETEPQSPESSTVRFDLDSARIKAAHREILREHAEHLANNPGLSIIVEGYADERGTQSYNMDLGMRRARAVSTLLQEAGIDAGRIRLVSYGEARPAVEGHNEAAWRLNRRAEIRYPSLTDDQSPTPGIATVLE